MKKPRKFYYGDRVAIVDHRYEIHLDHQGIIVGTIIHTQDRYTSYELECECGIILHPKPSDLVLVRERYIEREEALIDQQRRRFLECLNAVTNNEPSVLEEEVDRLLELLTPNRKTAIIKRFGLDPKDPTPQTYQTIADEDGVTRQETHRRVSLAMKKLERK